MGFATEAQRHREKELRFSENEFPEFSLRLCVSVAA
jgi:hypothetical protein